MGSSAEAVESCCVDGEGVPRAKEQWTSRERDQKQPRPEKRTKETRLSQPGIRRVVLWISSEVGIVDAELCWEMKGRQAPPVGLVRAKA